MTIAVFNYNNDSVDIITVDHEYVRDLYDSDVERYLVEDVGYDPEAMQFMSGFTSIQFIDNDSLHQIH